MVNKPGAPAKLPAAIAGCHVLVVDDTEFNREIIASYLRDAGLRDIGFAADGQEALDAIRRHEPDLVILDIMMPGLDGFEVCRRLRSTPEYADLPILVQTALVSAEDRNKAFAAGTTDLVPKPIDRAELVARVRIHLENRRLIADLRQYRMRVEGELEMAQSMFDQLLPSGAERQAVESHAGVRLLLHTLASDDLCGDLWGMIPLPGRRFAIYLADVPGRGLSAALLAFRLHTLLREARPLASRPGALLAELNQRAHRLGEVGEYACVLYGVVDPQAGLFTYAGAGAPNPYVVIPGERRFVEGDATGLPIAITPDTVYEERTLRLPFGAALALHSNAIPNLDGALRAVLAGNLDRQAGDAVFERLVAHLIGEAGMRPDDEHFLIWIGGDHGLAKGRAT